MISRGDTYMNKLMYKFIKHILKKMEVNKIGKR